MIFSNAYFLIFIGCILTVQGFAYRQDNDDSDEYEHFKRYRIFGKNSNTAKILESPGFIDQLVHSSSGSCTTNPCQNGGTCVSVSDDYWCKCSSEYYGKSCQSKFHKRDASKRRSVSQFLQQIRRVLSNRNSRKEKVDDGRFFYDSRNGIYF